jgi:cytochrome c
VQLLRVRYSVCATVTASLLLIAASAVQAEIAPWVCPQTRSTATAPKELLEKQNPIEKTRENIARGERLYNGRVDDVVKCVACHGREGDGRGALSDLYTPAPRNFACGATMKTISDGQLYWVTRFGSPMTAMPPHPTVSEDDAWKIVLYLRQFAK